MTFFKCQLPCRWAQTLIEALIPKRWLRTKQERGKPRRKRWGRVRKLSRTLRGQGKPLLHTITEEARACLYRRTCLSFKLITADTEQAEFSSSSSCTAAETRIPLVPVSSGAAPTFQHGREAITPRSSTASPLTDSPTFKAHSAGSLPGDFTAPIETGDPATTNQQVSVEEAATPGGST
jgi:hypothetical protein